MDGDVLTPEQVLLQQIGTAPTTAAEWNDQFAAMHRPPTTPELRDQFAMAALTGLLANGVARDGSGIRDHIADPPMLSYAYADAMLEAREAK